MARPGSVYPQATVTAGALADRRILRGAPSTTVREAWQRAQRAGARTVVTAGGVAAEIDVLERACRWGLGGRLLPAVAWHGLPRVGAQASEVTVRRALAAGEPMVVVQERGAAVGVIAAGDLEMPPATWSVLPTLEHPGDPDAERRLWLLRTAGKLGEALGMSVFAVGGFVRDVLLGRPPLDIDLVVEGDGVAFATRLAEDIGGRLVTHPTFGTAVLDGARTPDGQPLPRLDVATARSETYARPGALPNVQPAPLGADLARRDFSVNAMALALAPAAFGRLIDPMGGRRDLAARRLRPLHPLAFVEDPTRVVRAARYGARLGFALDAAGRRALALATGVPAYPGLSAARLRGELALTVAEPTGWRALADLARWGGFRFAHPGARAGMATARRLRAAAALADGEAWRRLGVDRLHAALAVVLLDQRPAVRRGVVRGLGIVEEAADALAQAPEVARAVLRALRGRPAPSVIARALRAASGPAASAAWVEAGTVARRRIEWYWSAGQAVRPHLSGAQVMGAGVAPGPAVGACLAALRDARLDGRAVTEADERELLMRWRQKGVMR